MRKKQNVCICTFSKYLFYILLEYFLADFHYYLARERQEFNTPEIKLNK